VNVWTKAGLVGAGYVAALLIAAAVVAAHIAVTQGPTFQASSGMYAFGDGLLFLAVFGVVAIVPTSAALFLLRPFRTFWRALAAAGVVISATGIAALVAFLSGSSADATSRLQMLSAYAVLRILVAPLFGVAFLLAGVLSPFRRARITLLAATFVEAVVFLWAAGVWLVDVLR
jgi:hypothetical protein